MCVCVCVCVCVCEREREREREREEIKRKRRKSNLDYSPLVPSTSGIRRFLELSSLTCLPENASMLIFSAICPTLADDSEMLMGCSERCTSVPLCICHISMDFCHVLLLEPYRYQKLLMSMWNYCLWWHRSG